MICNKNIFIGFIKVGYKHLFIYDEIGVPMEINPLCVLDFYTYETCQRKGYGKIMFTEMLNKEKIEPRKMGYDRPSHKFINFLNKYFGLKYYVPQNNNFVVFKDYFNDVPKKKDKYDIYNNYSDNYSYNYNRNSLTQRKTEKYNNSNNNYINENKPYNNLDKNKYNRDEKDFCSKIYKEYSKYNDNKKQEKYKKEEYRDNNPDNNSNNNNNNNNNYNKKYISYIYRPSSSEYGAFFNMNK